MEYGQIKEIQVIDAECYSVNEGDTLPLPNESPSLTTYYLVVSPEIYRFGFWDEYTSKSDWDKENDEEAKFTSVLDCLFAGTLFKGRLLVKEKKLVVQKKLEMSQWFNHWTNVSYFNHKHNLFHKLGITDEFMERLGPNIGCTVPVQYCECGHSDCFTRRAFIQHHHSGKFTVPCVIERAPVYELLKSDIEDLATNAAGQSFPLEENNYQLAPEMFYWIK